MSDDAERWREKYLKGIEQQDKLEKRWDARLDLLRRGLVRSSLAAEGSDRAVDECMKEMREIVRKDDMDAGLAALIPRLEKAVLDSEHRREVRVGQISTALTALVTQLQALPLPRDVRKPLKRFAKDLEERASQARELPLLLSELSGLQGKALTQLEKPEEGHRPGFCWSVCSVHGMSMARLNLIPMQSYLPKRRLLPIMSATPLTQNSMHTRIRSPEHPLSVRSSLRK